jgi:hypothetical protein
MTISRSRRGLALPAAVFTLAVIMLFIAGSAFATTQEARASAGTLAERVALEAAEYGAAAVTRDWDPAWNVAVPVGQTHAVITHALPGGASSAVRLTRTSLTSWWVVSEGTAGGSSTRRIARRAVNVVVRLDLPPDAGDAALGVADSARVIGSGAVIGTDSAEVFGACSALAPTAVAGVALPDTTRAGGTGTIAGIPPLRADSTIGARVMALDSALVPDIVMPPDAIVTPAPIITAGACDTVVTTNWGDPSGGGACATHLPVIRALGNLTVRGGVGQGIILAAGDVVFESGATFAGLVIALDDVVTGSGGGTVLGAALALDARRGAGNHTTVANEGLIRRSSCRLRLARLAAASPVRIRERWWAEFD